MYAVNWSDKRTSISKIIDNVIENVPDIQQAVVPSLRDLALFLNASRPRIIHLHYNGEHKESDFLNQLSYKPRIVHTVHGSGPSIFTNIADKIVCIDEFGLRNNDPAKSVFIENSVDVENIPKHMANQGGICNALRFSPDQMQPAVLDLFARLNTRTYFYGSDDGLSFDSAHDEMICQHARQYENIACLPYCNYLEWQMTRHSLFSYYLYNSKPERCYGLVAMEAVSLGMPIVALKKEQAQQQYIIHGHNGFIADTDDEFIDYCAALVEDRDLYLSVCANAAEHAKTIKNSMPDRHASLYKGLL
jgi:hypothetical protein